MSILEFKGDVVERAFRAYARSVRFPEIYQQPEGGTVVQEFDGKEYVVLENINGLLAVYLVKPNGGLKRLSDDEMPPQLGENPRGRRVFRRRPLDRQQQLEMKARLAEKMGYPEAASGWRAHAATLRATNAL